MEDNKIELPFSLGLVVWKILQKEHNIKPRENAMGFRDFHFTEEELKLITSLDLKNPSKGTLKGISLLPNLQVLKIQSTGITAHKQPKDIQSIDDSDMIEISKCKSLQSLSIINQANLEYLDLTDLTNLNSLEIINNKQLDSVYGLNNLKNLWVLSCYGNNRLHHIDDLDEILIQNKDLHNINLDLLLFPDAIGYNHLTGGFNQDALKQILKFSQLGNVSWCEALNGNRVIKTNTSQMIELHNRACQILSENIPDNAHPRDIIVGIEEYLSKNVKYDYAALKTGKIHTEESILGTRMKIGQKTGTNSAYNALILNSCVCQGYTRGMQYLLKLKGIDSHDVDCYAGKDTTNMSSLKGETIYSTYTLPQDGYHSIICIDDFDRLYDDPCWNACLYQQGDKSMPWLLRTKSEISEDHTLSFEERDTENDHLNQSRNLIESSIKSNALFRARRTRLGSLGTTKMKMKEQVKGQILEGDIEL